MKEAEFQAQVIQFAKLHRWRVAWFRPVRVQRKNGSVYYETPVGADGKGWPDLVLVRGREILFVELKVGKNKQSEEQYAWHAALVEAGVDYLVWRPENWPTIEEDLR